MGGANLNTIIELARKDIKLKYSNSLFGYLWMFVNPILMLITLYIVFSIIMKLELEHYQMFLLLGIIAWNFFADATSQSLNTIVNSMGLFKKVKLSVFDVLLGSNLSSLVSFGVNIFVLLLMMLVFKINIFTPIRLFSLLYFVLLIVIVQSFSLIISTIYLYFEDIKHLWTFFLMLGFWLTPIIYPESFIPQQYLKYFMLNPLARIISHLRNTIVYNYIDSLTQIIITIIITLTIFFASIVIYNKFSKKIYELI